MLAPLGLRLAPEKTAVVPCGVPVCVSSRPPSSVKTPAFRNAFTSAHVRLSLTRYPQPVHQSRMLDFVETGFDVGLQNPERDLVPAAGEHCTVGAGRPFRPGMAAAYADKLSAGQAQKGGRTISGTACPRPPSARSITMRGIG